MTLAYGCRMKNKFLLIPILILIISGCESGVVSNGAVTSQGSFGNLIYDINSISEAYAEVEYEPYSGGDNAVVVFIHKKSNSHSYGCMLGAIPDGAFGDANKIDILSTGNYDSGANQASLFFDPANMTLDAYDKSDATVRVLGCELIEITGDTYVRTYLDGVLKSSYKIGSSAIATGADLDPVFVATAGKIGYQASSNVKIKSFSVFSKKP